MTITYSRPSGVNPPRPFQNRRPSGGAAGSGGLGPARERRSRPAAGERATDSGGRSSCSASAPRPPPRTTRAAAFRSDRVVGRNLARGQDEHPARLAEQRAGGAGLEVSLELLGSVAGALVQKDQVQVQAAAAGVDVPLHELADQRLVAGGDDAGQHDRAVAGDGVRPKPRLTQAVGGDGVRHAAAPGQ